MKFLRREEVPNDLIVDDLGNMRSYHDQGSDDELTEDIRLNGVHDPILLRTHPQLDGIYQMIDGRRRDRCNRIAGNNSIPADIYEMNELEALQIALSRNIQRENPDPVGLGYWLTRIRERNDELRTQTDLGEFVNKSQSWVSNMLNAYEQAVESMKQSNPGLDFTQEVMPTERHARALRKAPEEVRDRVIDLGNLGMLPSAREIERMVKARNTPQEVLEKYDPVDTLFDDAFLAHRLSVNAGLTVPEAKRTVDQWRRFGLPWQSLRKTRTNLEVREDDPRVQMYKKLSEMYPSELIDVVDTVADVKTMATYQKYCRRFILLLLNRAPEGLKQTVLDEFRGI